MAFWFTGGGIWLAHHAARWAAAQAGLLPRDILGFLAHADERLLLRHAGGGYQFLHRTLQDHLASGDPEAGSLYTIENRSLHSRSCALCRVQPAAATTSVLAQ